MKFNSAGPVSKNKPKILGLAPKHVGQVPYSRGFKFAGKEAQNFGPFLLTGPAC